MVMAQEFQFCCCKVKQCYDGNMITRSLVNFLLNVFDKHVKGCSLSFLMIFVALMISPIFRSKFVIEKKRHDFVDCSSILADHTKEITGNAANREKFDSSGK